MLQALSLAGGVTDRGSTGASRSSRIVDGKKQEIKVKLSDIVQPGDTIIVHGEVFLMHRLLVRRRRPQRPHRSRSPDPLRIAPSRRHGTASPGSRSIPATKSDALLLDYVKVLYKRRWTAVTIFLLIVGERDGLHLHGDADLRSPDRLLIEAENQNVVSFKAVLDGDQTRADYYQTQYNILQSRALARRTLDELKLWDTAPVRRQAGRGFRLKRTIARRTGCARRRPSAASGARLRAVARHRTAMPGADETAAQSRAIDRSPPV